MLVLGLPEIIACGGKENRFIGFYPQITATHSWYWFAKQDVLFWSYLSGVSAFGYKSTVSAIFVLCTNVPLPLHCSLQVKRERKQGRQKKRWEDNIREWTDLEFARSQRAVENRKNGGNWL